MTLFLRFIPIFFALQLLIPQFAAAAPAIPHLAKAPLGERWFSISKEKEQTGFNRIDISEVKGGYEITVESGAKMKILGFSRDAVSSERYLVNPDLSLRSFDVDEVIDGKPVKLKGEVTADGVRVTVTAAGKTKEKLLKTRGAAVYPPPVVNMYPLMQG
ncbi:MAG TPA: transglutaminase domain-containing protein, partial [Geobacteraceae bacterium]